MGIDYALRKLGMHWKVMTMQDAETIIASKDTYEMVDTLGYEFNLQIHHYKLAGFWNERYDRDGIYETIPHTDYYFEYVKKKARLRYTPGDVLLVNRGTTLYPVQWCGDHFAFRCTDIVPILVKMTPAYLPDIPKAARRFDDRRSRRKLAEFSVMGSNRTTLKTRMPSDARNTIRGFLGMGGTRTKPRTHVRRLTRSPRRSKR